MKQREKGKKAKKKQEKQTDANNGHLDGVDMREELGRSGNELCDVAQDDCMGIANGN